MPSLTYLPLLRTCVSILPDTSWSVDQTLLLPPPSTPRFLWPLDCTPSSQSPWPGDPALILGLLWPGPLGLHLTGVSASFPQFPGCRPRPLCWVPLLLALYWLLVTPHVLMASATSHHISAAAQATPGSPPGCPLGLTNSMATLNVALSAVLPIGTVTCAHWVTQTGPPA